MTKTKPVTVAAALLVAIMAGQAVAATPTAYTEYGGVVGTGNRLRMTRVPVMDANGAIAYRDVLITLKVSTTGALSLAPLTVAPSPELLTSNFVAGRYFLSHTPTVRGTLAYGVGSGGSTVWTLLMDAGTAAGVPLQSVWQTGTPAPDVLARLVAAKIMTSPTYSYGLTAVPSFSPFKYPNGLMAAAQVANTLTLVSYNASQSGPGGDQPTQTGSVVLTRCVDAACSNAQ